LGYGESGSGCGCGGEYKERRYNACPTPYTAGGIPVWKKIGTTDVRENRKDKFSYKAKPEPTELCIFFSSANGVFVVGFIF
jgi:hypothetical protein